MDYFFLIIQVKAFFSLSGLKISYYSLIGFISIILGYIAMYSLELPSHTSFLWQLVFTLATQKNYSILCPPLILKLVPVIQEPAVEHK